MIIVASPLIHALEGRMRLKLPGMKGNPQAAQAIEFILSQIKGVDSVVANPVTGSVLIFYHSHIITQQDIIRFLIKCGYLLPFQDEIKPLAKSEMASGIMARIFSAILEVALTKILVALV